MKEIKTLVAIIRDSLTDKDRSPRYRGDPNPMAGHCYVASEVFYHAMGGKAQGWKAMHVTVLDGPHWFMKHSSGIVVDITADQFPCAVPYDNAKGKGMQGRYKNGVLQPSKRASAVLARVTKDPRFSTL